MRKARIHSLAGVRRTLIAGIGLSFLLILAIEWGFGLRLASISVRSEQSIRADLVRTRVRDYFLLTSGALGVITASLDPADHVRNGQELESIRTVFPNFSGFRLLDVSGRIIAMAGHEGEHAIGDDLSADPGFRAVRETGQLSYSSVYLSDASGAPAILITQPRRNGASFEGALCGEVDLGFLSGLVSGPSAHEGTITYIVDAHGILIAHPDSGMVARREDMSGSSLLRLGRTGLIFASIRDESTGQIVLGSVLPLGNGWTVVTMVPRSLAYRDLNRVYGVASALVLCLILGMMAAIWRGLSSALSPIQALAARVTEATTSRTLQAKEPIRLPGDAPACREVAELVDDFNIMLLSIADRARDLSESRARLASYFDDAPDGIFIIDGEGTIKEVNPAAEALVGVPSRSLAGRSFFSVLAPDDTEAELRHFVALKAQGRVTAETEIPLSGGGYAHVNYSASILPGGEYIIHCRDVTERMKMEEALQRSQHMESIGLLAGGIAHDFNNLLSGIFGNLELAKMHLEAGNGEESAAMITRALGVFARARDLTRQLLTFSKGGSPMLAPLNPARLLEESCAFTLTGSRVELRSRMNERIWTCQGDRNQLGQVFDNLAMNARQAMPDGGTLYLEAFNVDGGRDNMPGIAGIAGLRLPPSLPSKRYVLLRVRDTGPGFTRDAAEKAFLPFFSTKAQGSGLGLATAFSIVKRHKGLLELDLECSQGACFNIWLPACEDGEDPCPPDGSDLPGRATADSMPGQGGGQARGVIIILDDEQSIRDSLCYNLERLGWRVESAASADVCLSLAQELLGEGLVPEAFLLDLTLPGGPGGKDILPQLKELCPRSVALAMSGYSEDPVISDPCSWGFDSSLRKPFLFEDLAAALEKAFSP